MKDKYWIDRDGVLMPFHNAEGQELLDPTPVAPPIGFVREPPLHERIRAMVQAEHARLREAQDVESFDESEDFRIPGEESDDPREDRFALMPGHEWEENYNPPKDFKEMHQRLVDAGWTPPSPQEGQGAPPAGSIQRNPQQEPLDAPGGSPQSKQAPQAPGKP